MQYFFENISEKQKPKKKDLIVFVDKFENMLEFIIMDEKQKIKRLWRGDYILRTLAQDTFVNDIKPAIENLKEGIWKVDENTLQEHGLIGRAVQFKYAVVEKLEKVWRDYRSHFTVGPKFKSFLEAIDALLDSIIDAIGYGGIIKEFKDTLMALVPSR